MVLFCGVRTHYIFIEIVSLLFPLDMAVGQVGIGSVLFFFVCFLTHSLPFSPSFKTSSLSSPTTSSFSILRGVSNLIFLFGVPS